MEIRNELFFERIIMESFDEFVVDYIEGFEVIFDMLENYLLVII